jgi:cyclase
VRSVEDVRALLQAGADKVSINTAAVERPDLVAEAADRLGSANLIVAIDARRRRAAERDAVSSWEVFTHGGRSGTGIDALEWALRMEKAGAGEILLTSMDRDGTGDGYDLELTRAASDALTIPVIASGGAGELSHLAEALDGSPEGGGASAALAASIFHFGRFSIAETKRYLSAQGIHIRPAPGH